MRAMIRAALLAAAVLLLVACGGEDEPAAPGWLGPPKASASGEVSVVGFNKYADGLKEPAFERSPLLTALEFLGLDNREAATTSLVLTRPPEGGQTAEMTATLDGLLDDSIRAERYVLELERRDDAWRLASARWAQRCWPDRGHQDFSPELCL
jgi:hypothetical protein